MALADPRRRLDRLPSAYSLPITARLPTTKVLAPLAGPIPLGSLPPRPKARRIHTGRATVPRERMRGREPLLAPLQQTHPCPTMSRNSQGTRLRVRPRAFMLDMDQGSANSQRSSPGSGDSTPLRDALDWSPPAGSPSVQPNHAAGVVPPIDHPVPWPPVSPRFPGARFGPLIPRNWPPVSPRLTVIGGLLSRISPVTDTVK